MQSLIGDKLGIFPKTNVEPVQSPDLSLIDFFFY